jgi:hypothetical protein
MKKIILAILLFTITVVSTAATNNLKVLVAFDTNTTNYTTVQMNTYSVKFVKNLNDFIINSNLDTVLDFSLAYTAKIPILAYPTWNYDQLRNYYFANQTSRGQAPKTTLTTFQKYYNADVVIVVSNPHGASTSLCGISYVPQKGNMNSSHATIGDLLEEPIFSIVFVTGQDNCMDSPKVVVHEVGHSFGLQHGRGVQNQYPNEPGHYNSTQIISSGASGYANYSFPGSLLDYHDIMGVVSRSEPGIHHPFFSNSSKFACGFPTIYKCGDNTANAVGIIKSHANRYAKRSNFFY